MPCHNHAQSPLLTASRVCYPAPPCDCCRRERTPNNGSAIPEDVLNDVGLYNLSRSAETPTRAAALSPGSSPRSSW